MTTWVNSQFPRPDFHGKSNGIMGCRTGPDPAMPCPDQGGPMRPYRLTSALIPFFR